jgi:glycosyltransferase involved in cell wall biosynthesis
MKIVFVFFNPEIRTGGHRRYLELAEGLAKRGNEVFLVKNEILQLDMTDVRIINLPYEYHKKILPYSLYAVRLIRKNIHYLRNIIKTCDYIMIHGETHFFAGCILKKIFSSRLFYAVRSDTVTENNFFIHSNKGKWGKQLKYFFSAWKYRIYEIKIAAKSDLIAFQSRYDRDNFLYRTHIRPEKTCIIKGNIAEPWFKKGYEQINHSSRLTKVLYLGSIGERKGVRYLLEAFRILRGRGIPLKLTLVGKGPLEEEMEGFVVKFDLSQTVTFAGYSPLPFEFMKTHDIIVVPSIFDSYPDVILEGLHADIPVIASRTGGIPDILEDDRLLFPSADAEYLAMLLERLYNSPELYNEYRDLCAGYHKKFLFDWPEAWETEMKRYG